MTEPQTPQLQPPDPLAAWTDLGLRTLDLTLASAQNFELVSRSWQQWLAAMETLLTPRALTPARNAFGVQRADLEHAVAHADRAAERATARKERATKRPSTKRGGRAR